MSITISNCNEICHSPTNQSQAKMLYTFSKSSRFDNKKRIYCDKFYNQPKSDIRTTSLGYGNKHDFFKNVNKSPPPTSYNLKSDFQTDLSKGTGFGEGRQEMKITGPFVATQKNKNPGPGHYQATSTLNKLCYSLVGKNIKVDKEKQKLPGPGTYQTLFMINEKGKYFSSKHKSSCIRGFNDSIKRQPNFQTISPGPGKYENIKNEFSPQGKYVLSRMQNSLVRNFGSSCRQPLNSKSMTPGPGNYRLPSQFGYYISKTAPGSERDKLFSRDNKENQNNS